MTPLQSEEEVLSDSPLTCREIKAKAPDLRLKMYLQSNRFFAEIPAPVAPPGAFQQRKQCLKINKSSHLCLFLPWYALRRAPKLFLETMKTEGYVLNNAFTSPRPRGPVLKYSLGIEEE